MDTGQDVTDRIPAEKAQAFLASLVEFSQDAIISKTLEGVILSWNHGAEELYGYGATEVVGKAISILAPPDRMDELALILEKVCCGEKISAYDTVRVRKDGSLVDVSLTVSPLLDATGKITSVVSIGQDITERKRAQEAARESEAKLQAIFDGVKTGILVIDPETHRIVDANPVVLELVGATRERVVGSVCHKFICPADKGRCPATDLGQVVDESERLLLTATDEKRNIIKTVRPVVIGGRNLLLESFVDITARKRAEQSLGQAEEHFRSLFAAIPLPTFFFDAETFEYLEVNDAAVSACGYSREELLKMRVTDLAQAGNPDRSFAKTQALGPQPSQHSEGRYRLKDGQLADVETEFRVLDFRGRRAVLSVSQNVTERKRAEAEMAERHRLATLVADVGLELTRAESLRQGLQQCTEILVRNLGATFARVWTVNEEENVLELQASAGMYTHLDGGHARVPLGKFKIGRIAESGEPHLTNSVQEDSWVGDPEWARREGMVAFAGYPLKVEGRVLGVVATFARQPLTEATLQAFAAVADNTAQFIVRKRAEEALRQSEERLALAFEAANDGLWDWNIATGYAYFSPRFFTMLGYAVGELPSCYDTWLRLLHPDDKKNVPPVIKEHIEKKNESYEVEFRLRSKTGEWRWILSRGKVVARGREGETLRMVGTHVDITERKQANEALRDSEEKYRVLYESSRDAIMMLAPPEWAFTAGNPAAIALFGARNEREFVATAPWNLSPEYQPEGELSSVKARQMIEVAMEKGSNFFEWTHQKLSGEEFFATVSLTRMIYQGRPYLQATVQDITDRKRGEAELHRYARDLEAARAVQEKHTEELARLVEELAQERDHLGTLMDNIPDAIYFKDEQSRFTRVNSAQARTLGIEGSAEALGKTDFDFFPREDAENYFADECRIIETGEPIIGKLERVCDRGGKFRWVSNTEVPVKNTQGRVIGIVGVARDVTEWKAALEALRDSEEGYRELFENASDFVYTTDLELHLTSLNRKGRQTLGYSEEEATHLSLAQLIAPKHWELINRGNGRLLAGDTDLTAEIEVSAKDGRLVTLEVKPRLIYRGGKPIGVQGIARDITGRDAAEMELRHTQKLESVGRLASGIAHEINTPIQFVGDNTRFLQDSFTGMETLISKYRELCGALASGAVRPDLLAEVARIEEESDCAYLLEEIPKALTQTLEGVTRVATIVRAMKEFAHPESKEMAAADLNRALQSTLTVARNELKYVADVETEFGNLPLVICNIGDLNQVFLNLLVNAAHALGDVVKGTGKKGQIRVRTTAEGNAAVVAISDTGCGIPEAIRNRVFDPFFTTKEVGRGTGQGLAIARAVVVERHKGSLTFESEVGKGTTFYIRLPFEPGQSTKEAKTP